MGPVSMSMCWPNVTPGVLIHTRDIGVGGIACIVAEFQRVCGSSPANEVERQEDREYDNSERYKDDEESLQVAKEEISIKATLLDYLSIPESKDGEEPAPWCSRRWFGPLAQRDQVGFGFAERCQLKI